MLKAVGTAAALYSFAHLVVSLCAPKMYYERSRFFLFMGDHYFSMPFGTRMRVFVFFCGFGLMTFHATEPLVWMIPEDWGLMWEGEWWRARQGIQVALSTFGGVGSIVFVDIAKERARQQGWEPKTLGGPY